MSGDDAAEDDPERAIARAAELGEPIADAADPAAQAEALKRNASYAQQRAAFWRAVLADPVGRREIWDFVGVACHAFETKRLCGPNGFPDDAGTQAAFAEQLLGQRLYQSLQLVDFEGAWLMLSEHDARFPKPKRKR